MAKKLLFFMILNFLYSSEINLKVIRKTYFKKKLEFGKSFLIPFVDRVLNPNKDKYDKNSGQITIDLSISSNQKYFDFLSNQYVTDHEGFGGDIKLMDACIKKGNSLCTVMNGQKTFSEKLEHLLNDGNIGTLNDILSNFYTYQ